ncbi:HAD-IC family P-type ATPase [Trichothermofontia sp.]
MIQAIHTNVPGRARYKVAALYRLPALQRYLEEYLSADPDIRSITAHPLTGTVLIHFKPECPVTEIEARLREAMQLWEQGNESQRAGSQDFASPFQIVAQPAPTPDVADLRRAGSQDFASPFQGGAQSAPTSEAPTPQVSQAEAYQLPLATLLQYWGVDVAVGLGAATAAQRLTEYGPNQLGVAEGRSDLSMLLEQFTTWPVALLSGAALLSGLTGGLVDAIVIMGVVGVNAVIGYVTESQSEKIIRSLRQGDKPLVQVRRDGQVVTIPIEAVVPGDVLLLRSGHYVAADARLIQANNLSIDESALTGESIAVNKRVVDLGATIVPLAERVNMVFKGTFIVSGEGLAVVTATGPATEMGKIQTLVGETEVLETPLQRQLGEVSGQLVLLCGGVCGAIFAIGLGRGYGLLEILKTSISLAVAAVPEGLPTVATTTLALGIQNMRQRKILIRGLNAVETLGSVQVVCLDKTGTLTRNQMAVVAIQMATAALELTPAGEVTQVEFTGSATTLDPIALQRLLEVGVLCSESEITQAADGTYTVKGTATESALVNLAIAQSLDVLDLRQRCPRLQLNPRTDSRNLMSTVHRTLDGQQWVAVKGSPPEVLERCRAFLDQGVVKPLTPKDQQTLERANQALADRALRVLAIAYRDLETDDQNPEQDLIWVGLVGLADPIREGVPTLIEQFHQAGIDTVMVTGDQSPTAYAIGRQLNLNRDQQLKILDAYDLSTLEPEALAALADKVDIFARISPADKLQIVRALQSTNKVVAMTGDGINDTPALKAASVGLAMGSGRAGVVHEVADVVIQDDNLSTIIDAVSQGRTIYNNIRKSVHFLLATNLSEIIVMVIATIFDLGEPLNALQLLWLNLVTDVFPGLGLALEPPEPTVLNQPPRDPNTPIIRNQDFQRIGVEASVLSVCALAAYGYAFGKYGVGLKASTVAFMSLTIGQVLHTFSCRSETHRWFDREPLPRNPYVEAAIAGALVLQLLPLVIPGLGKLLKITPLDPWDYGVIATAALLPLLLNEATKPNPAKINPALDA